MTILAETLANIKPSPTIAVTQKASELKAAGHDIIGLGAGEPDFNTPDHIKMAAVEAIVHNDTRYTAVGGTPVLKSAICQKFKRDNGLDYDPSEVMASAGGKHVLYNAFQATLNPGDEVIIPAPYWVSYPDMVLLAGGVPRFIDCPQEVDFKLQPEPLAVAITPKTKWLVLNSPSNPTGAVMSRGDLEKIANVLRQNPHVWVISDDIYEHILYDANPFQTLAAVAPDLKPRILTVNGVSKAWCMTGWRLGFCGGDKALIKAMTTLQSQSTTNPSSITQAASVAALNGSYDFMAGNLKAFKRRRDMVVERLNDCEGLSCNTPDGAFYVYPSCEGMLGKKTPDGKVLKDDGDVAAYLLEQAGVAVVHGAAFGLSPHFRISYATSDDVLQKACDRIQEACSLCQ